MKKILIPIIISLNFFGCKEEPVNFRFCDNEYNSKDKTCFIIKNDTKERYAFFFLNNGEENGIKIIIKDENGSEPKLNSIYFDKLFPNENDMETFLRNEKKDSLLWKCLLSDGMKIDYHWIKKYRYINQNKIILAPNERKQFFKKIVFFREQLESSGSYYTFEKNKKYIIQAEINFDSLKIKEYLTPSDLDSLNKNHIKIFHGNLRTEKIPMIIN